MAFLLSAFAAYLMAAEYKLYKQVDRKYRSLLGKYDPGDIPDNKPIHRVLRLSFGKILVTAFICFAVIIQFLNGLVLFHLVRSALI
jgi:hypothetical protein